MRALKIMLTTLLILIVLIVGGLFIFLKQFDINKYKPQIIDAANKALEREVQLGAMELKLSLKTGVALTIHDVVVKDSPEFSTGDFLKMNRVNMDVDVMSYLKKREIVIAKVELRNPQINAIRNEQGVFNFPQGKKTEETPEAAPAPAQEPAASPSPAPESQASLPAFLVKSIQVIDGELILTDKMMQPPVVIPVRKMNLDIQNFSLSNPFHFMFTCSLFSPSENIKVQGLTKIDLQTTQVRLEDLRFDTDLAQIAIDEFQKALPQLASAGLEAPLKGKIQITANPIVADANGLRTMNLEGVLEDGQVKTKTLKYPADNIDVKFNVTEKDFILKELFLYLASGKISVNGRINDYLKDQIGDVVVNVEDIKLNELIDPAQLPVKIEGKLVGRMESKIQGFNPETIKQSLNMVGGFEVREGKLVDFNLFKIVMDNLSTIPGLGEKLVTVKEKYKEKLQAKDTILSKIKADTHITEGWVWLDRVDLATEDFGVLMQGKVNFDQDMELTSSFAFSEGLSKDFVEKVPELAGLMVANQIQIPMMPYQGKATGASKAFIPDILAITKKVALTTGKEKLGNELKKLLGIDPEEDQPAETDPNQIAPDGSTPQKEKRPEEQLIDSVLDSIFK